MGFNRAADHAIANCHRDPPLRPNATVEWTWRLWTLLHRRKTVDIGGFRDIAATAKVIRKRIR
jgi:hypothetical protein